MAAKTKAEKEKELKEELQREADVKVQEVKATAERAVRRKNKKIRRMYIGMAVLAVLFVAGIVAGALAYNNLRNENKRLANPQESAKAQTEQIKKEVAALIDVPTDEEPTIANVADAKKAKEQSPAFFAKAENDDRLILYSKAKKAILYRPSTKKIIEVSTLNIGNAAGTQGTETQAAGTAPADGAAQAPAGTTTQP